MSRSHNHGLSKRCGCARRKWASCGADHPWHFDYFKGRKYRFSLDVLAKFRGVPPPRTKGDAEALADLVRSEIRSGTFLDPHAPAPVVALDPTRLTIGDVADQYLVTHIHAPGRRLSSQRAMTRNLRLLRRTLIPAAQGALIPFEQKAMADLTRADIEAIRTARRAAHAHTTHRKGGEVGVNRVLERLRHLCSWAVEQGFIEATPFRKGGVVVVKLSRETPRSRRLVDADEEGRLLASAGPHLRALIVAAIATGCRKGELLSLQWKDVKRTTDARGQIRQALVLAAAKTKTATVREVPVGPTLAAVLEMRRLDPDGLPFGPDAYIFGNECGEKVASIKKAWMTAVLRAHGHTPRWLCGGKNQLSAESRAQYAAIGLTFHDLRREFGSRVLESGSSLVEARDLLGHANISQTSTYLQSSAKSLTSAIERKEQYEQQLAAARAAAAAAPAPVVTGPDRVQ